MKAILLALALFSLNAFASREIMFIQAYELAGPPADGDLGVTISILNVSNVDQTVSWSGGIIPNRLNDGSDYTLTPSCGPHGAVPPHAQATLISASKYKLAPQGFVTLWCAATVGSPTQPAGGEGVVKMTIKVDEDRGAVMASGAMYLHDRQSLKDDHGVNPPEIRYKKNWGGSGGGPFQINGGRAF